MIVLDTNVLSEPLRPRPDPGVLRWIGRQAEIGTTAITVGELLVGLARLPPGRRRDQLTVAMEQTLDQFRDNVLSYDQRAAHAYARLSVRRREAGAPLSVEDGMIAAICSVHRCALATRNARDFGGLDLVLVNPWEQI
ncbi:type II toxin-antitoxin system VapC family toxin [Nakamurella sp.]|uniref:type II toxin-antitoxin system VapC family toxin n=1 Tax=Nakamurella sp. TaxID=1869182 RepID=UPI00378479CB